MAKEFFQTTGTEIKASKISPDSSDYQFYSYQEEWEKYFQEIQSLPNRAFYVKHKIEGGIIPLQTETIFPAHELAKAGKEAYNEIFANAQFGLKYLNPRAKPQLEAAKETKEKPKSEEIAKPGEKPKDEFPQGETPIYEKTSNTLEEITASLTPIEKAMLWAIGTGNYQASDIYEKAYEKIKSFGGSKSDYSEYKNEGSCWHEGEYV